MPPLPTAFRDFCVIGEKKLMVFSHDMRWRAVVLLYLYNIEVSTVAIVLGLSCRSIARWYKCFERTGNVDKEAQPNRKSRWPLDVCAHVEQYVRLHPCFYFEELRAELQRVFPLSTNMSDATICRALKFDLNLTRKVLTKRAAECVPDERRQYVKRLLPFYSGPDQLVFVDETSKDAR